MMNVIYRMLASMMLEKVEKINETSEEVVVEKLKCLKYKGK